MNTPLTLTPIFLLLLISSFIFNINAITIQLNSQQKSITILNLNKVNQLYYDQMLIINVVSQSRIIYNKTLGTLMNQSQNGFKRIQVFNYQEDTQNIQMYITIAAASSVITTPVDINSIIRQSKIITPNFNQGIFMLKDNIKNYMLPFNLVSEKYKKIIVEESQVQNIPVKYNYQPFLETFWNQHKEHQLLLSWIPYFSMCQYKSSSRIFLEDIVNPWESYQFQIQDVGKICNRTQTWLWGVSFNCKSKQIATQCILEQLNVANTKKQPWWKNTGDIIFYFLNSQIINGSLLVLDNTDSLTLISQKYYSKLIPLIYTPLFDLSTQTPNKFTLHIDIATITDMNSISILRASLTAQKVNINDHGGNTSMKFGETLLFINVQYLSNFQTLLAFGKQTYLYVLIFTFFAILVVAIGKCITGACNVNLNFIPISKLLLFPAIKGFALAFVICGSFLAFFFLIAGQTNFSAIILNFDNNTVDDNWQSYTGRFGLTIFFVGNFLLSIGISQSFKVMTLDQIKIILEDDQLQKQKQISQHMQQPQDQQQQQNRPLFVLNNMNSHRKYLFSCLLSFSFILLMLYYVQINLTITFKCIFCLLGFSILHKVTIAIHRHSTVKELLYLSAILITLQSFLDMMIYSNGLMWEIVLFYVVKLGVQNGIAPSLEIFAEWACVKLVNYLNNGMKSQEHPSNFYRFCNYFKQQVSSVVSQSRYQKSLFYTNLLSIRFTSLLFRPFMVGLMQLTIKYNYICKDVNEPHHQISKIGTILFCFAPIDIFIMLLGIKFFQSKFNLDIIKCLEFNRFKFNKRKIKWINDSFVQTRSVQSFYREFQKFCFSSQMYLLIFIISFSLFTVMIGLKIVIQVGYVSFIDPAMLLILCVVWITGNVFSLLLSFIAIKLKFYERKQDGRMRAKLEIVQKILKKNDCSQYLQTDAIKNYFLFHCKQWIVQNLATIFDKEDFFDNNYQFLLKYKHYKSMLKKHKIQERKKQQRKIQQNKNQLLAQSEQKANKMVIKLPRKQFQQLARPLLSSWLYIAKQFTFLKNLVCSLKHTKKKQTCEFCSMNIQLEVIQKIQFASIVNQYRILNVGRVLNTEHFINFYKFKQKYITLCIQCKDRKLYLEKKHLDINGAPRRVLQKWVMIARSRILHKEKGKDKQKEKNQ